MLKPFPIATINVSALKKQEFLREVESLLADGKQTFVSTPNSEFLFAALRDRSLQELFNKVDIALADGIAIMWAERFLSIPFRSNNYYLKILEAWVAVIISGARILLTPSYLYKNIPEKITGADVFFDLMAMAERTNHSVYFVNHRSNSAETTAKLLQEKFPKLVIAGTSRKNFNDKTLLDDISVAKPDMLFVSYGQPTQERWIDTNLKNLPVKFAMGIGGTFDYAAGFKLAPPSFIRQIGLEWLFRLITQPRRWKRIYNAVWGLVLSLVRYKVFHSMPYRKNMVAVAINKDQKIMLCKRVPASAKNSGTGPIFHDYWQFPQGGLDSGEDPINGGKRELQEETGMKSIEVIGLSKITNRYEWNNASRRLFFQRYHYVGQEQQTLFVRFIGDDSEIQLDNHELLEYEWLNTDELLTKIADERKPYAREVLVELFDILEKKP